MVMADNVQPDAGEQRNTSSSELLLSTDPLQDEVNYKLSADDADPDTDSSDNGDDDDYDSDNGDSDGGDDSDDSGPLVVEIGPGATDGKDSDGTDESDPDYSDN
jgi:hypothetical protein